VVVCPVDGLVPDPGWAVCHGRGCPLSSERYAGTVCSEGQHVCRTCGSVLWRVAGGNWTCRVCAAAPEGTRAASCPKVKGSQRLAAGAAG
jgi:ribosomal protein L37AE/L43A